MMKTEIRRIDFKKIALQSSREYKIRTIKDEMQEVGGIEKVLITDCLSNKDRDGLLVMKTLDDALSRNPMATYKIKVLKDKWGKPVKPGDIVEWKFERKLRDMFGRKITNKQFKEYARRGEIREIEIWHDATVDDKGCIEVQFRDAAILLDTRGVHFQSGMPLTDMKEFSKGTKQQHHWLYAEVPSDSYEQLPTLGKQNKKTKSTDYHTEYNK